MHRIIAAVVYADSRKEAIGLAEQIFGDLCTDGICDYFNVVATEKASTQKGEAFAKALIKEARDRFEEDINALREALARLDNDRAFSPEGDFNVRWRAYQIGAYRGGGVRLYDQNGAAIRNDHELKVALTKTDAPNPGVLDWRPENKPVIPADVWIVAADAHS